MINSWARCRWRTCYPGGVTGVSIQAVIYACENCGYRFEAVDDPGRVPVGVDSTLHLIRCPGCRCVIELWQERI